MGALRVVEQYCGAAYVMYGKKTKFRANAKVETVKAELGFKISGTTGSWFGYSVSGAGYCCRS